MIVKKIEIQLETDEKSDGHATIFTFADGKWSANGPFYPRISDMLDLVWEVIKTNVIKGERFTISCGQENSRTRH